MGLEPAQRCLQRDPSPPPVIGPSSRLATLQVAYLGPGTAAVSSRARAGPRSHADTHTTRTHVQGWSVFPRVRCSRVTWSPQGTCAYLGAQADGRAAGRAGAQGLELGWARSADRGLAFALGEMGLLCPRALTAVQQRPFTAFGPDFWDRAGHGLPGGWCGPRLVPGCSGCLYWCEAGVGTEAAPGRHQAFGSTVLAGGDETPVQPGGFPQGKGGPAFLATEGPSKDPGATSLWPRPTETCRNTVGQTACPPLISSGQILCDGASGEAGEMWEGWGLQVAARS